MGELNYSHHFICVNFLKNGRALIMVLIVILSSHSVKSQNNDSYKISDGYLVFVAEKDSYRQNSMYKASCKDFLFCKEKINSTNNSDIKTLYEKSEGFLVFDNNLGDTSLLSTLNNNCFDSLFGQPVITFTGNIIIQQIRVSMIYKDVDISDDLDIYFKKVSTPVYRSCFNGVDFLPSAINLYKVKYIISK